jgi:hypothetical protein
MMSKHVFSKFLFVTFLIFAGSCKVRQQKSALASRADIGQLRGYGEYNNDLANIFYSESDPARDSFDFARFTDSPIVIRDLIGFSIKEDDRPNYAPSAAAVLALNYAYHTFIDQLMQHCSPMSDTVSRCPLTAAGREVVAQFFAGEPSKAFLNTVYAFEPQGYEQWRQKHAEAILAAKNTEDKKMAVRLMLLSVFHHPRFLLRTY